MLFKFFNRQKITMWQSQWQWLVRRLTDGLHSFPYDPSVSRLNPVHTRYVLKLPTGFQTCSLLLNGEWLTEPGSRPIPHSLVQVWNPVGSFNTYRVCTAFRRDTEGPWRREPNVARLSAFGLGLKRRRRAGILSHRVPKWHQMKQKPPINH